MQKTIFPDFSPAQRQKIESYLFETFHPEDRALSQIREKQSQAGLPMIQVGAMDSQLLETLVRLSGAKKSVEIGTLAGYSGTAILRGMGETGHLWTLESERSHSLLAQETFQAQGWAGQVTVLTGLALEMLPSIESHGPFDLVFIDANKDGYPGYCAWAEKNLRVGGVLIADNTLGWGMIADQKFDSMDDEKAILGLRALNDRVSHSKLWRATLIPTSEGLTVAVRV